MLITHEWQILGSIVVFILVWFLYRLHKRWSRRCRHCGSMWHFKRWHEREFRQTTSTPGKCKAITTTYYRCDNPDCPEHGVEFVIKSYPKEFSVKKMTC